MQRINYITSNAYKFKLAKAYFESNNNDFEIIQQNIETPEIQDVSSQAIAKYSAEWACEQLRQPVICHDLSFAINGLHGFPGPFVKYINEWLSPNDILKMLEDKKDRSASFIDVLAYAAPGQPPQTFTGEVSGTIIASQSIEDTKWSVDALFIPDGHHKTLAAMDDSERDGIWTHDLWDELMAYLSRSGPL